VAGECQRHALVLQIGFLFNGLRGPPEAFRTLTSPAAPSGSGLRPRADGGHQGDLLFEYSICG